MYFMKIVVVKMKFNFPTILHKITRLFSVFQSRLDVHYALGLKKLLNIGYRCFKLLKSLKFPETFYQRRSLQHTIVWEEQPYYGTALVNAIEICHDFCPSTQFFKIEMSLSFVKT